MSNDNDDENDDEECEDTEIDEILVLVNADNFQILLEQ